MKKLKTVLIVLSKEGINKFRGKIVCTLYNLLKINLPNDTVFVTHDDGFKETVERM
jgi:hypothetical protein